MSVETLTPEEAAKVMQEMQRQLGLLDNPALQTVLNQPGGPQRQHKGKPIISYAQYLDFQKQGLRMDEYMMVVANPRGITQKIQASKLRKYMFDPDYPCVPVELYESRKEAEAKLAEKVKVAVEEARHQVMVDKHTGREIAVYWCSEQYPECGRFFDRPHARSVHQNMDHKKALSKAQIRRRKNAEVSEENGQGDAPGPSQEG